MQRGIEMRKLYSRTQAQWLEALMGYCGIYWLERLPHRVQLAFSLIAADRLIVETVLSMGEANWSQLCANCAVPTASQCIECRAILCEDCCCPICV